MTEQNGIHKAPARGNLLLLLPLAAAWICAAVPAGFYLLGLGDPNLPVAIAIHGKSVLAQASLVLGATLLLGLVAFPPLPAWLRRFVDRTKTAWSTDSSLLARALSELKHFETAQKHYEAARIAWTLADERTAGQHLMRSVELDPTLPHAQHLFGQYLPRSRALPAPRRAFEAAERLDPGHAFGETLLYVAHLPHPSGDAQTACETFEQHAREHGASPRSSFWRAEALLGAGDRDAAALCFVAAAKDPKVRLTAEENWFRAKARVRCWSIRGTQSDNPERQG